MQKQRIDLLLVERGLAENRHKAQALVLAGCVLVAEQKVEKPGQRVDRESPIRLLGELRHASRAGAKLEAALEHFAIVVRGRVCADLGASTGGFTDCLLQRGARGVAAYDVGKGQLAWKLRSDPRVTVRDRTNVRYITAADISEDVTLVTVDLSFISLTRVLGPLRAALRDRVRHPVDVVALVKPQFEVGKGEVGKGGVVRDAAKRARALDAVVEHARGAGFTVVGNLESPVAGASGNREFLVYLRLDPEYDPQMARPGRKIGLIFKKHDPRVPGIAADLVPWLVAQGAEVLLDADLARAFGSSVTAARPEELPGRADVVAVFGGDGTLLYAARLAAGTATPILGINLGSLGFLTEVKLEEARAAFQALLSGHYELEQRVLLQVDVFRKEEVVKSFRALNDVVINKGALARIIELEVEVDSQTVAMYRADGLILSTPTGSTAYSLAAGGPILYPTLGAFIITPICPHTVTNRPVVVPERSSIVVRLRHGSDVMLTVDGQVGMPLQQGDRLSHYRAESTIRLVQPTGNNFFRILREKLKWG